ncbi:sigma-70 family RNA polymerase sigma factor [Agromyces sp. G08B096]|uniref:Sigma-70 family RNA polymerase sigma factor n=1 Tax=Agromyces sp. G08B096 TaxID=3156399 RepID=A0AAU7W9W1_9MICO
MSTQERSDAALWLEATSGTASAFGEIYDRYRTRVFRAAYGAVRHVDDAEDIVAIVFLEAWRKRDGVRFVDGSLLPWLLVVTHNATRNVARSKRRWGRLLAKVPPAEHAADPAEQAGRRIDLDRSGGALRGALGRLSADERRVVDLCLIEELPTAAVAAVLHVPEGTVKSRLHRARRKLQRELGGVDGSLAALDGVETARGDPAPPPPSALRLPPAAPPLTSTLAPDLEATS